MPRPLLIVLLVMLTSAALGACGQKGDLYLPEETAAPEPAPEPVVDDAE
ncbi:MAG TPA: lipoprotein [Pseudomonadales bacterium]|nr:lipoprotein [Pseudomonadales bacterium]